ncbi:hypothetical protein ACEWY4_021187 [Coilia grayii]|uniref:Galactosylgalactosylxylosylprotein 3-beta-glucuronosyltransferase n=1 Tax=Coilia grayii TaxID=363190 RepID=A0ABD1J8L1_9TELE
MRACTRHVQVCLCTLALCLVAGFVLHLSFLEIPPDMPVIYVITPTHRRPTQKADLIRMANTVRQVPNLHWIVVEDAAARSPMVAGLLSRSGLVYTHMNITKPDFCKKSCVAKGTEQRNLGLDWLRKNRGPLDSGVVYFGDDDNTYDLELFEEMRYTKLVSVWPVGLIAARWYERPLVHNGTVVGWYTGFPGRRFAIDMAGKARFVLEDAKPGMQETNFLSRLTKLQCLEPKANNCTKREAEVILAKARLEAELRTLQHEREVAAATAEAEILESAAAELELDERQSDIVALRRSIRHTSQGSLMLSHAPLYIQLKGGHISSTLPLLPRSCTGHTIQSTQIYSCIRIILTNQL